MCLGEPTANTATGAAAAKLQAMAYDYLSDGLTTRFNVRSAWFMVSGVRRNSRWTALTLIDGGSVNGQIGASGSVNLAAKPSGMSSA